MTRRPRQLEEAARRRTGRQVPVLELSVALGVAADVVVVPHVGAQATPLRAKVAREARKHQDQLSTQLLYERGHSLAAIGVATGRTPQAVRHDLVRLEKRAEVGTMAMAEMQIARTVWRARLRYAVRR